MIVPEAIEQYVAKLTLGSYPRLLGLQLILTEMEKQAERENIPIIDRASIHFICSMLQYKGNVKHILELGTAIGYSTLWLAGVSEQVQVESIERDERRYQQAREYVYRAGLEQRVRLYLADAREFSSRLNREYDLIFIDAAKGQYQLFFESYAPFLKSGGLIITDNVLFRGYVAMAGENIANKRLRPLVEKIKQYNRWLKEHPHFETTFVPLGDGLALSIKR